MFSGHGETTSYLGQLQVQELNYLRLSGIAVTTALTYEVHYTQIRDFCITLDGHNKEAAEMKHAQSIMKAELNHSMNLSQADPGTALQLSNQDEVKAEDEDEVKDEVEDEVEDEVKVMVVGTVGKDEVVDVDATTIIYLMISIGTLINLPTINWSTTVSVVANYNLTMWIAKPCPPTHPCHHLLYPRMLQLRSWRFRLLSPHPLVKFIPLISPPVLVDQPLHRWIVVLPPCYIK